MKQTQHYTKASIAVLAALGMLSGCNWVDSTGRQSNSAPTIVLDDGTPDDGFSVNLNEEGFGVIDPSKSSDGDGAIVSWTWDKSTVAAGALDVCNTVDGFNSTLAAQSLKDACTDEDQCEIQVETEEVEKTEAEIAEDQASLDALGSTSEVSLLKTIFTLTAPKLKAPIGVTHRIIAKDNDGGSGFAEVTLCLVAINEAPEAVDDNFTVLEGVPKEVLVTDPVTLLSNDIDDLDVSNAPLSVNPVAVSNPQHNNNFSLGTDGGFYYYYAGDPSRPAGEETFDEFEYEISDGIHTSQAKATLRIVSIDDAPVLTSNIPDIKFYEGIADNVNFGKYFKDPEGATLVFSESNNALPASFDRTQLIKGFLKSTPESGEVDQYSLVLSASDDLSTTSDDIVLTIAKNQSPTFSNIANQTGTLKKSFSLDISKYTNDPEGQPLTYKLSSTASFFKLDGSVLNGTPSSSNAWKVTISVSDGYNSAVSKSFTFTVVNSAPVLTAAIPDQSITVNQKLSFNVSKYFSDPEGQSLSYKLTSGPSYLSITGNGVISGTPSTVGNVNVTVQASDGEKTVSDTFTLKVNNPSPVLASTITNRTYTAGDVVNNVNIAQHFKDPNGDKLTFTATGLPASQQIKITTAGIMSGSATTTDAGTYTVTVTASDGVSSVKGSFKLTINKKVNTPPKLTTSGGGSTVTEGANVSYTSRFSETDVGDTLTISGATGGSGLTFKQVGNTGVVSGTANKVGTFTITVTATDKSGAKVVDSYTVKVNAANTPPKLTASGGGSTVTEGANVSYTSRFSETDVGDTLTISGATGGSGLTFKQVGNTGVVSGTANKVGTFTITVTATDKSGAKVVDSYTVKVVAANSAPTISEKGTGGTVENGDAVSYKTTFVDSNDTLTLTWDLGGSGLTATKSGNSVVVSGTAVNSGSTVNTYTIKITAKDTSNASVTDTYTIKVNPTPVTNTAPSLVTGAANQTVTIGQMAGNFVSTFTDPDTGDTLKLTINKGGADFLVLQETTGKTATVLGRTNKVGVFDIVVTVTDDAKAAATDSYRLTVNAAAAATP